MKAIHSLNEVSPQQSTRALALVAITLASFGFAGCGSNTDTPWILGAANGRVIIFDMKDTGILQLLPVPIGQSIFVVNLADQTVQTVVPALAYRDPGASTTSDGERIVARDPILNTLVVQDVLTGDVQRFFPGAAGFMNLPAAADAGFVLIRNDPETSANILDMQSGELTSIDFGLENNFMFLVGDYALSTGPVPPDFAPEQLVAVNWRTGERRVIATDEVVYHATVIGTDVLWAGIDFANNVVDFSNTDPVEGMVVHATSFIDGTTRNLGHASLSIYDPGIDAIGEDGFTFVRFNRPHDDTQLGTYTLIYQPYAGDPVTLREGDYTGLGKESVFLDGRILFIDLASHELISFDTASGARQQLALPGQ